MERLRDGLDAPCDFVGGDGQLLRHLGLLSRLEVEEALDEVAVYESTGRHALPLVGEGAPLVMSEASDAPHHLGEAILVSLWRVVVVAAVV
jgi:hypothetical protein